MARTNFLSVALAAAALLSLVRPATAEPSWPAFVDLGRGQDIDEDYRAQFGLCDTENHFRDEDFSRRRSCADDPNQVTALRRLPSGAVAYVSKLAVDLDGSALACGPARGPSDQCPTSLMLPDASGALQPVDADRIPYVVIPNMGPPQNRGEFDRLTGVRVGDFGVVIWRGVAVPVIVADTGPYNKLGEGSLALHRALGHDQCAERDAAGVCVRGVEPMTSIEDGVVTLLFPGTARPDLTAENLEETVRREGARLWAEHQAEIAPPARARLGAR